MFSTFTLEFGSYGERQGGQGGGGGGVVVVGHDPPPYREHGPSDGQGWGAGSEARGKNKVLKKIVFYIF